MRVPNRRTWWGLWCVGLLGACVPGEHGGADGGASACGSRGTQSCEDDEFCKYPVSAACGEADAPGVCTAAPDVCYEIFKPVCGCDGVTYTNDCFAAHASASVRHEGACDADGTQADAGKGGTFCGGIAGIQCADGQYCNFPTLAQCGAGDQGGTCAVKPQACTAIYDPVCGCDDKTYGNACTAASVGVSVLHKGACTP